MSHLLLVVETDPMPPGHESEGEVCGSAMRIPPDVVEAMFSDNWKSVNAAHAYVTMDWSRLCRAIDNAIPGYPRDRINTRVTVRND